MKTPVILVLLALSLSGCVTTSGGCPALKTYTRAQMQAVAAEISKNPNGASAAFIADYGQLRAACRTFN